MKNPTKMTEWQQLVAHQKTIENQHMRDWFENDTTRFEKFSLSAGDIFLDYSRNRITQQTLSLLVDLAKTCGLAEQIKAIFTGTPINTTEQRPVLHSAFRNLKNEPVFVNDENVTAEIIKTQQKVWDFVAKVHAQTWRGATGKPIKYVVNIGIGGSHTGPMMATYALKEYAVSALKFHFMASVDTAHLQEILDEIEPEATLFIISSKSFSTIETLTNAKTIMDWMQAQFGIDAIKQHFVAVTAAPQKAQAFGIPEEQIFPIWDWVGGRYSIWSAISLPLMLMIGPQNFAAFLEGGHEMDKHFREAAFSENIPVILALLGIWYTNFFGATAHAIIPYAHRLRYLIPYLQQADMESNGKSVSLDGEEIDYNTGPVIFGEEGLIGQHAYHQLLHQGRLLIPADFIVVGKSIVEKEHDAHQDVLLASALSQTQALMRGKTKKEAAQELGQDTTATLANHKVIAGNKPCNLIFLTQLNPRSLGALIAMYEHKIFVQGVLWNINSFDQWGVELGKQLLPAILLNLQGANKKDAYTDSATSGMINRFLRNSR